jgi:hypothetical protein
MRGNGVHTSVDWPVGSRRRQVAEKTEITPIPARKVESVPCHRGPELSPGHHQTIPQKSSLDGCPAGKSEAETRRRVKGTGWSFGREEPPRAPSGRGVEVSLRYHRATPEVGVHPRVEFEPTTDGDGNPDWIMLYRPGPKARAEYRALARREGPTVLEVEPLVLDPPPRPAAPGPSPLEAESNLSVWLHACTYCVPRLMAYLDAAGIFGENGD